MPPTFRAAVLCFRYGNAPATRYQVAGLLPQMLPCGAAIGTPWMLADSTGVAGQPPRSNLASHHVADPDHLVLDIVDILQPTIEAPCLLLGQNLRH